MDLNHFLAVQVSDTLFLETPGKENFAQYGGFRDELPQKSTVVIQPITVYLIQMDQSDFTASLAWELQLQASY